MYIKKMVLRDYKSYQNASIFFDSKFNVIIGENNVGKTTLFEALQLWKKCFDISILDNGKDFYSDSVPLYISFGELYFLRLTKDEDIFFEKKRSCTIGFTFFDEEANQEYNLSFELTKPNVKNAYIRVSKENSTQFHVFKEYLDSKDISLTDFIFIQQTSPVAKVLNQEPYMYNGQIIKKIVKGKSNEVLRNKILQSLNKDNSFEERMKTVLDCDFKFIPPKRNAKEKEEYIELLVEIKGKKLDIYLQGSGFLQAAEIFSTINVMDNALNIMLIDEPDSHISPRIQNNLLKCLSDINNTQTFVITHNDNFVSDLNPQNIIFINEDNKNEGTISPLTDDISIDLIHHSLGGIISGLTRLQKSRKIIFVEGKDDIAYLKRLNQSLLSFNSDYKIDFNHFSFWYIRGKDYIPQKVMTGKQLLSQAVSSCTYGAIFDKDFSTVNANNNFKHLITERLGRNSFVHTHNGYCIESVLFSDISVLKVFLSKILPTDSTINLDEFINNYINTKKHEILDVSTLFYKKMKDKFKSQKTDARTELQSVEFDDFASEINTNFQFIMLKDNIKSFVLELENLCGHRLFERDDDGSETISSRLLEKYFDSISCDDDIYPDYKSLLNQLKNM